MASKNVSIKVAVPEARNAVAVALLKRHGGGVQIMKDRRTPRGGTRNKQRDYREGAYGWPR